MRILIATLLFMIAAVALLADNGTTDIYFHRTLAFLGFTPTATIIFGGDIQLDRYIRQVSNERGLDFVFSCIDDTIADADAVVANLEGPITDDPSVSMGTKTDTPDNYRFTFPPDSGERLAKHHIGIVDLGNNHTLNYGYGGIGSTIEYLNEAGVLYFGDPIEYRIASSTIGGVPLAFISYNEFSPDGPNASGKRALSQVTQAREDGFVPVVFAHWGEEYASATPAMLELAHSFVDAGAKLVVGSHPHVIEKHELYLPAPRASRQAGRGVPIYYSLGNFIFDQYWDDNVTHGLLLSVTFSRDGVTDIEETAIRLEKDGRTCPAAS